MGRRIAPVALLLLAFLLWAPGLAALDLWGDELYTVAVTGRPLPEMLHVALIDAVHPPFYYLLLYAWRAVAGGSAFALRLPSVWAMGLGLALVARLARELKDARAGRIALLLGVGNPFFFWYAQEMRMYALLFALTAAEMWLLLRALRGHRWAWWAQVPVTALLLNTHYFGFFALLPSLAFLAAERRWRSRLGRWLLTHTLAGLTFLPWFYAWINREPKYVGVGWIMPFRPLDLLLTWRTFFFCGTEAWPWLALLGGIGSALAFGAAFVRGGPATWKRWLALAWSLPWALTILLSVTVLPLYVDRYFVILLPALFVWLAWGLRELPPRVAYLALGAMLVAGVSGIWGITTQVLWQRPQWRDAMVSIAAAHQEGEALVSNSSSAQPARAIYAPELPPVYVLYPPGLPTLEPARAAPACGAGQACWAVWEAYFIRKHFPPEAQAPLAMAREAVAAYPSLAGLVAGYERCRVRPFTHVEVWYCSD
jgi:uncharacterized membrane protein